MGSVVASKSGVVSKIKNIAAAASAVFVAGACASGLSAKSVGSEASQDAFHSFITSSHTAITQGWREARILHPALPLQCVPYARKVSGFRIWGNAWTWWRRSEGRYRKSAAPAVGSVMAFKRTQRLRLGHVAVVTRILNDREIVVEHANWLNRGRIHVSTPVRDVSRANDWSRVRVWYTPGRRYGSGVYPVRGFILPDLRVSANFAR